MEMKREFLQELKLEKEVIDKIMAENGVDIEAAKKPIAALTIERDTMKDNLKTAQEDLKKFDGLDLEAQKKMIADLEKKYETDTKELTEKLTKQDYDHKASKFVDSFKFTSTLAKKAALAELKKQEFKLDGETILGGKDFMEKMKIESPEAFVKEDETPPDGKPPVNWGLPPKGSGTPPAVDYSLSSALKG